MTDESHPIEPIRGTIILADNVYQDAASGKHVICGTYSWVRAGHKEHHFTYGLSLYARIQVQEAGTYIAKIKVINKDLPSTEPPMMEARCDLEITDPNSPVEVGLKTPSFYIPCPVSFEALEPGEEHSLNLLVWLSVNNHPIGSSPLKVIFGKRANKEDDHE